jgi:hypothetical protein
MRNSKKVLKSLKKVKYSTIKKCDQLPGTSDAQEDECIICWGSYNQTEIVTKLKCNDKHYYHSTCIENWITAGNNSCPMCREPIDRNLP